MHSENKLLSEEKKEISLLLIYTGKWKHNFTQTPPYNNLHHNGCIDNHINGKSPSATQQGECRNTFANSYNGMLLSNKSNEVFINTSTVNLKDMLSDRSQPRKVTCYMIPCSQHSEKHCHSD
jgi:hypothetical protein